MNASNVVSGGQEAALADRYPGVMSEVRTQFDYYLKHQDALVKKYDGRYVVIAGESVVGDFEHEIDAYAFAVKNYEAGTFVIQRVSPGNQDYSQTFHSRASIPG